MRADLPKLLWSEKISERVDLDDESAATVLQFPNRFPKPDDAPFDLETACKNLRTGRRSIPITESMSDEAVRFWFFAGTETAVVVEDAVDAATAHDRSKAFTLKQVEERFRAACAASRWDLPQPHLLIPLMLRLVSRADPIRLLLVHPRPTTAL